MNKLNHVVRDLVVEHEARLNAEDYVAAYDWDDIVAHYIEGNELASFRSMWKRF